MNWDALGAIGELVGALAVVLTLGYLATQVRQNTRGMKVAAKLEIDKQFTAYTDVLLNDSELLELQLKGISGQNLSEIEGEKFSLLMQRVTWHFSSMHYQYKTQEVSEDDWYQSQRLIRWFTLSAGYRLWWELNAINYSVEFRDYLNKLFESNDAEQAVE